MKKLFSVIFSRAAFVGLFIVMQCAAIGIVMRRFAEQYVYFYALCTILSIAAVLVIINKNGNPAYKIAWIIPILLAPIFGGLFYLVFGKNRLSRRERLRAADVTEKYGAAMAHGSCAREIAEQSPEAYRQSLYIEKSSGSPPFCGTSTEFLPIGEVMFERLKQELEKAKRFIFMEYFIIADGEMWGAILEILERKAAEGVDVRLMYDDVGCALRLPADYSRRMEKKGIRCCAFNRLVPMLSPRFNNRDHRKICVVDGNVGFTGGINLADEYINAIELHGHWLDSGIMLKGSAVWTLTCMFLTLWDYTYGDSDDFSDYAVTEAQPSEGWVQPFTDAPLDDEAVGETVYLNIISRAVDYVYICTPYLIIDNEMITALTTAAKSGVDVRIVTPHIADKRAVHAMTRSFYDVLLEAGVKLYEYTPGFIHSKTFVSDDKYGVVGTINMDYRSLYLHYECAVWLYKTPSVAAMKADYINNLENCERITREITRRIPLVRRFCNAILRVFAPLL